MKSPSITKYFTILTEHSRNINVDLGKGTVLSTVPFTWLKKLNKQKIIPTFLLQFLGFSEAFNCINHELLSAYLNAYGFDSQFISAYLNFRKQKTKVGSIFSGYLNILFGVLLGFIARAPFSMSKLAMFFQIDLSEFSSYADDNTLFAFGQNPANLTNTLQSTLNSMFQWYQENYFKANADKCHLILSSFCNWGCYW